MSTAIAASAFTGTLGVELHMQYTSGSAYANVSQVINEINYLNPNGPGTGVAEFRDSQVPGTAVLQQVASGTGAKADLYLSYNPGGDSTGSVTGFESVADALMAKGQLGLVEGGLEVDNAGWGFVTTGSRYNGYTGWQGALKMQQALFQHYNGKVKVALWSLANPSDGLASSPAVTAANQLGIPISSVTNEGNFHFYPHNGQNPAVEMGGFLSQETGYTSGLPFVTTETGVNDGNNSGGSYAGNGPANGAYTLDNMLNLFKAGCKLSIIYELNNDTTASGSTNFENYWGIFNNDGSPKPAATYMHNYLSVVSDTKAGAAPSSLASLNYTTSGMANPADTLLTEKADGTLDLTLWDQQNLTNSSGGTVNPASRSVTVNLGQTFGTVQVFDPSKGSSPIASYSNASSVAVSLAGVPLVIQMGGSSTPPPPPPSAPPPVTVGTGPDSLVFTVNEDAYQGDAQFTVSMDGVQVGGTQTTTAIHSANQTQTFTFKGSWGAGQHTATVNFLNDAFGGTATADRNLYVTGTSYDGTPYPADTASMMSAGPVSFKVGTAAGPAPVTVGTGNDSLLINLSEDAYQGDAQFTVSVDGSQIGGTQTTTALFSSGQVQPFTFRGNWQTGTHQVALNFLNDAYGGTATADRNLYVQGMIFDGTAYPSNTANLMSAGPVSFNVANTTPVPVAVGSGHDDLVLNMSEDLYQGNAQFIVSVDGVQVGGTQTTTALHNAAQTQQFDFKGDWGIGQHAVVVNFLNDAFGGTATTDRNLYVGGMAYDGVTYAGNTASMLSAGPVTFHVGS